MILFTMQRDLLFYGVENPLQKIDFSFYCPISKYHYLTEADHKDDCIYKYCKEI